MQVTRRVFLKRSLAAGGALAFPWVVPARAVVASERITLGVIGFGPRCHHVLGCMLAEKDVQCVAVCDVQASRRKDAKTTVDRHYGNQDCATYRDFRELLARPDIDAVAIETGDRWHAPASILAAKAGKDVYCEKPCTMSIAEGAVLEETMQRYGRVYQAGTQRRSIGNFHRAVQLAHTGKLGKVHTLHASVIRPRVRYDYLPAEAEPVRDVVDWDLWLGTAPWRPYNHRYIAGDWRSHYDFDAGVQLLEWGVHTVDLCQWANKSDETAPLVYEASRDKLTAKYANGVTLSMDYLDNAFGNRSPQFQTRLGTCPVRFEGNEGWVETGDSGEIEVYPASLRSELRELMARRAGTDAGSHVRNFLDCIKSRAQTAANPTVMRHSHLACHAAVAAWLLGRKITLDPVREIFVNDEQANRLRSRAYREPWIL